MDWRETKEFFALCLPKGVSRALSDINEGELSELRVRAGQPVRLITASGSRELNVIPNAEQVAQWAESLCEHALYARSEESRQGYVTLRGGHRMGLCGRVLLQGMSVRALREISSLCIRVAGQWAGASDCIMPHIISASGRIRSIMVVGAPGSGKTTILRDCCRQISDMGARVCVADERSELAAMYRGLPQLDVGANTDVLDGCPKETALRWLLRAMSPDCLVTDELSQHADAQAALEAAQSGVAILASAHGESVERALERSCLYFLRQRHAFELYALLDAKAPGRVKALYDEGLQPLAVIS